MQAATNASTSDRTVSTISIKANNAETVEVLEELLAHSIQLRNMYKYARRQSSDIPIGGLHELLDGHYKEQIRLVDVLVERIRALNGADRVFAGYFLARTQFSGSVRGRASRAGLLEEIFDEHEYVLRVSLPTVESEGHVNRSWVQDFAVGQVVLCNDQQSFAIREQLRRGRCRGVMACGAEGD